MTRRIAWLLLAACFGMAAASSPASAKDAAAPAGHKVVALPEPLTRESIRELVSRLDDAEVRALLIKQLDRSAAPAVAATPDDMASLAHSLGGEFARIRERAAAIFAAAPEFPSAVGQVFVRITEPHQPSHLWLVAGGFLLMLGAGAVAEFALGITTRGASRRFEDRPVNGLGAGAVRFLALTGIGLAQLAAFAAGSMAVFLALWQGHEATRLVVLLAFMAVVGVRVFVLLARLLLEPAAPGLRVLPFDDRAARILYRGLVRFAAVYAFFKVATVLLSRFGDSAESLDLLWILVPMLFIVLLLDTTWKVRAEVGALIRGPGESGHLRRLLADLWPALAAIYLLGLYLSVAYDLLLGNPRENFAAIGSVILALVLPLVDMLLCRMLAAAMQRPPANQADASDSLAETSEPVLRKAIHIVVLLLGVLVLDRLWSLDLFAIAERGLGGKIASALFGIATVTLIAWILWEVARTAIDRRMNAESVSEEKTVSRLRTLLPLLRVTLLVAILLMAVLSILAALGINIVPLLAGASVVGVAIGFGSQSLVRDIVSGAFFLMDDAFRLGEYIEVGDAKGTVEKIGVRSVVLRHHRGALNVLPYGEIKRLRNTSRDWIITKMEFRLAHDTDLQKVKQIMKRIGAELAADPEMGPHILDTLKSQGVIAVEDSGLVVRAKYRTKPTSVTYAFRREAYARILKAFAEAGIKFAIPVPRLRET